MREMYLLPDTHFRTFVMISSKLPVIILMPYRIRELLHDEMMSDG